MASHSTSRILLRPKTRATTRTISSIPSARQCEHFITPSHQCRRLTSNPHLCHHHSEERTSNIARGRCKANDETKRETKETKESQVSFSTTSRMGLSHIFNHNINHNVKINRHVSRSMSTRDGGGGGTRARAALIRVTNILGPISLSIFPFSEVQLLCAVFGEQHSAKSKCSSNATNRVPMHAYIRTLALAYPKCQFEVYLEMDRMDGGSPLSVKTGVHDMGSLARQWKPCLHGIGGLFPGCDLSSNVRLHAIDPRNHAIFSGHHFTWMTDKQDEGAPTTYQLIHDLCTFSKGVYDDPYYALAFSNTLLMLQKMRTMIDVIQHNAAKWCNVRHGNVAEILRLALGIDAQINAIQSTRTREAIDSFYNDRVRLPLDRVQKLLQTEDDATLIGVDELEFRRKGKCVLVLLVDLFRGFIDAGASLMDCLAISHALTGDSPSLAHQGGHVGRSQPTTLGRGSSSHEWKDEKRPKSDVDRITIIYVGDNHAIAIREFFTRYLNKKPAFHRTERGDRTKTKCLSIRDLVWDDIIAGPLV